jgi:hypothetical protein|nr:MAG TPA: tail tube protein [Bacteriophage sp.]
MNAMKSGAYPITLNGEEYGLLFSLNALDEMQERFGGYDKLHEVFNQNNKDWVKDTRWLFTLLINEARLAENENAETLSEQKVGRLINAGNLREIQQAIFAAFAAGTTGEKENYNNITEDTEGEMKAAQKS